MSDSNLPKDLDAQLRDISKALQANGVELSDVGDNEPMKAGAGLPKELVQQQLDQADGKGGEGRS